MSATDVMITIRKLEPHEFEWASARYAEIGFRPCASDHHILVAEVAGADGVTTRVGLGRLAPAGVDAAELSGIYVLPEFRRRGIADRIVGELVQQSTHRVLYCVPLLHLTTFYERFGFVACERSPDLPCAIQQKLGWCDDAHPGEVGLLIRRQA